MRSAIPLALIIIIALCLASPAQAERRVALVIGNGAYSERPLKNSVNDAQDMAASLKKLGFETTLLIDSTMQQMENAVREFGQKLRQGGMGLFYYAGHGVQVAGNNYLVPVKAVIQSESDVKYGCLDAGLVLGKMEDAGNGLNIIILDACRNNPFSRSFSRSAEQGLAKMDAPTGSLIAYSTSPGKIADDGVGKNGLYTQHLLKSIATPGLSVEEMFKRVRQGVAGDSAKKQVPWEASSLIGQFSFAGGVQTSSPGSASLGVTSGFMPSPSPALPADPSAVGVDLGGIEQKAGERAKTEAASRKKWADWLAGMKDAVAKVQGLEQKPGVGASDKAEAWMLLASKYTQKSPYTNEDDTLREQMTKQAEYWTGQARNEATAQAKAEETRLALERKRQEEAQRLSQAKANTESIAQAKQQQLALASVPKQAPPSQAVGLKVGDMWQDPVTGMEFVWVPGGSFRMGCGSWTNDCSDDEKPVHTVRLSGFWLGKFEVTQGQWQRVMGDNPSVFKHGDNYPVEKISWDDAKAFISKLNAQSSVKYRLPIEAEWEYAARSGGRAEKYAGGNDISRVAWFRNNSGRHTHSVGAKAPNGLGLYDMSGNVWEWCEDGYEESYSSSSQDYPVVTGGGPYRVFRGGGWGSTPQTIRAGNRSYDNHYVRTSITTGHEGGGDQGFRLVRIP